MARKNTRKSNHRQNQRFSRQSVLQSALASKQSGSIDRIREEIRKLQRTPYSGDALGILTVKDYINLGHNIPSLPNGPVHEEITWCATLLSEKADYLRKFSSNWDTVVLAFLNDEFRECRILLDSHEKEFGVSHQSLSVRVSLFYRMDETLELQNFLNTLARKRHDSGAAFYAQCFTMMAAMHRPWSSYVNEIDELESQIPKEDSYLLENVKLITTPHREISVTDFSKLIGYIHRSPLQDRLALFEQILHQYALKGNKLPEDILILLKDLAVNTERPALGIVSFFLGKSDYKELASLASAFGSYRKATEDPLHLSIRDIAIREKINKFSNLAPGSPINEDTSNYIIEVEKVIGSLNDNFRDATTYADTLRTLALKQPSIQIGYEISEYAELLHPYSIDTWPMRPQLNPFKRHITKSLFEYAFSISLLDSPNQLTSLEDIRRVNTRNEDSLDDKTVTLIACRYFYQISNYIECRRIIESIEINEANDWSKIDLLNLHQMKISSLVSDRDPDGAILACHEAELKEMPLSCLPIDRVFQCVNLIRPITTTGFGHLAILRAKTKQSNQEINSAVEGFLQGIGFALPSELCDISGDDLAFSVLRFCSNAEVIEWNIYVDSAREVANERIAICTYLIGMGDRLQKSEIEILRRDLKFYTEYLFRIQAAKQLATTRIYVPREAIHECASQKFGAEIDSVLLYKDNDIRVMSLKDLLVSKTDTKDRGSEKPIEARSWAANTFQDIFEGILDLFCWDQHFGLDGHLSMTIRHGTLLGQIRSPFQKQSLVTDETSHSPGYEKNEVLRDGIGLSPKNEEILFSASANLSRNIDDYHNQLRGRLIQLKHGKSNEHGLFDFIFTRDDIGEIWDTSASKADDRDTLITRSIDAIIARLNRSLMVIEDYFRREATEVLLSRLVDFENECQSLSVDRPSFSLLAARIHTCRTEVQLNLQETASWFSSDDIYQLPSFSLEMLLNFVISQNRRLHGKEFGSFEINIPRNITLAGLHFDPIYHLFDILVHNVVDHSGLAFSDLVCNISVEISDPLSDKPDLICVTNRVDPSVDVTQRVELIESKIDRARNVVDGKLVGSDRGSGFAKVFRILGTAIGGAHELKVAASDASTISIIIFCNLTQIKSDENIVS